MTLIDDVREIVSEQREYHELLLEVTKRDLLLRYKQTVMGVGWAVFMPLLNTAIFSVIFTRVAPMDVGIPYPVYAYCGLVAWNLFASSLRFSVTSLTSNINLVTKVYFPREVLPLSTVLVSMVDMSVATLVLVALMAYYGIAPSWTVLAVPVVLFVEVAFTFAVALLVAMANLFYRDVKYLFEAVIQVWMFATAVLYPVDRIGGWIGLLMRMNPMTPIIEAFRDIILLGRLPGPAFAAAAITSLVLLSWAWLVFHRAEFTFAENI
jgi:lipopolysaccharide transport system permease protein